MGCDGWGVRHYTIAIGWAGPKGPIFCGLLGLQGDFAKGPRSVTLHGMELDEARRRRVLRQHVMTDQLLGVQAVPISAGVALQVDESAAVEGEGSLSTHGRGVVGNESAQAIDRTDGAPRPSVARAGGAGGAGDVGGARLEQIRLDHEAHCQTPLRDLQVPGAKIVFGEGSAEADLMFVGEGPGQTEAELGRPFVGRAGELLDKMIVAMGFSRETVYITNVVKFRPPKNRTPTPQEIAAEAPYLIDQILAVQPKVIVALGGAAAKYMLDTTRGITALRGNWHEYFPVPSGQAIPLMPTFHPAFLLRQYTTDNRKKVWSDLQEVMRKIGE